MKLTATVMKYVDFPLIINLLLLYYVSFIYRYAFLALPSRCTVPMGIEFGYIISA